MIDYVYKTKPFSHQEKVFLSSRDHEFYALLMEQGTGKSKVTVDSAAWLYAQGKIDLILIVAPCGVQRNWILNECPAHMPDYTNWRGAWYSSSPSRKEEEELCRTLKNAGLRVVAMNIESFATVKGVAFAKNLLLSSRTMLVVDESSTIKNPKAIRTKNLLKLSVHAKYRRILTGTPITQGPLDLYTQFSFLDSQVLMCGSYYAFRNKYAVMREMRTAGRSFMVVDKYVNLDQLQSLIAPHSFRVTKAECLDLPEKLYVKRYVELSDNQRRLYNSLKKDIAVEFNGRAMSAPLALTRLLRLQQICGGFFSEDREITEDDVVLEQKPPVPIDEKNSRVESLIELVEGIDGKVIIWARFRAEISAIRSRLDDVFGHKSTVEYHGGVHNDDRSAAVWRFQNEPSCRFFISNTPSGGKGLTLTAANSVVYFSNDFSLENRLQSEDRPHRIGQTKNVTYYDFIAIDTLDAHIVKALREKKNIADLITGDEIHNWI